jgi:hypothetical protein
VQVQVRAWNEKSTLHWLQPPNAAVAEEENEKVKK